MERREGPLVTETPAPTAGSIVVFTIVVALLFGGMYLLFPDGGYRPTASNPPATVAEQPATPPATTGQGGNIK